MISSGWPGRSGRIRSRGTENLLHPMHVRELLEKAGFEVERDYGRACPRPLGQYMVPDIR